jgi:TolB protein
VYDPARSTFDIHVYDLAQGTREVFIEQASQPALSPNHERLAYRSWGREQRGISVRELGDGHTWSWVPFAEAARPIWSPNSENIVFPSEQETDRQWRIYRTQGLIIDRVRRHGGDILGRVPAWLPDGRIVYWECPLNECGLYVMQGDGSAPTRLTRGERDTAPAASPDGSQVAFMSIADGNWDIYRTGTRPADALAPAQLTTNPARDGLATWSPDGRWLAFVSDRDGEWAVWAMRPDGSQKQPLFDLGGPLEGEIAFVAPGDQHGWTWETLAWGP